MSIKRDFNIDFRQKKLREKGSQKERKIMDVCFSKREPPSYFGCSFILIAILTMVGEVIKRLTHIFSWIFSSKSIP